MVNGAAVKSRRERLRLSQQQAAQLVGWTAQRWSDFENERNPDPRLSTAYAVAKALRCRIDDLLREPESSGNPKADSRTGRRRRQA